MNDMVMISNVIVGLVVSILGVRLLIKRHKQRNNK